MDYDSAYWDEVTRRMIHGSHYLDDAIGLQKRWAHLRLLQRWLGSHQRGVALKTDLFEEAFGPDQFLSDLHDGRDLVIGMDISSLVVSRAKEQMTDCPGRRTCYVVCDVRCLPFVQRSLEFIISNSTLDHFSTPREIVTGLSELTRCLKPGGLLIITLDNGGNLFDPLLRLLARLGGGPYHIGPTLSIQSLVVNLEDVGLTVTDTTALIHNPRLLTTLAVRALRTLCPGKAERWIEAMLHFFEHLEGQRTKYLTGCFIAARAVKLSGTLDTAGEGRS